MKTPKPWDRLLWGVVLMPHKDAPKGDLPLLCGESWDEARKRDREDSEPMRKLLFTTREAATSFVRVRNAQIDHYLGRFRVVRVRETVAVAEPKKARKR